MTLVERAFLTKSIGFVTFGDHHYLLTSLQRVSPRLNFLYHSPYHRKDSVPYAESPVGMRLSGPRCAGRQSYCTGKGRQRNSSDEALGDEGHHNEPTAA